MAYKEGLVTSCGAVVQNVKTFNHGLKNDRRLRNRLGMFKAWYYVPKIDAVGPSKFIGYTNVNLEFYFDRTGKESKKKWPQSKLLDGRATEPVLQRWFKELEQGTREYKYVSDMVKKLFVYGGNPWRRARYSAPIGWEAP